MAISQSSMDIRLQKLICCIGSLGGEIADDMFIGNDCYREKLKNLKILIGFLNALECYNINDAEVIATGTVTFIKCNDGDVVNILINGISISGDYSEVGSNLASNSQALADQINAHQATYHATYTAVPGQTEPIIITGNCNDGTITYALQSLWDGSVNVLGLTAGHCSGNCLTEKQVLSMFEQVSEYCDICFPSAEYQFTDSRISQTEIPQQGGGGGIQRG